MARTANRFIDPETGDIYDWPVNHSTEEEIGRVRPITHGALTGGTGLVRQQGDEEPLKYRMEGVIFHLAQIEAMWEWWWLSKNQTIRFRDFAGDLYEVIFTEFQPTRVRTIRNPRDFANAPFWFWRYTAELEIIRILDGPAQAP